MTLHAKRLKYKLTEISIVSIVEMQAKFNKDSGLQSLNFLVNAWKIIIKWSY